MSLPTHFTGKIYFYLHTKYSWMTVSDSPDLGGEEYIYLGETGELHVDFDLEEATEKAVTALEQQIEKERAESARRVQHMKEQIQSLLALEAPANSLCDEEMPF